VTSRSEAAAALPDRIAFLGFGLIGGSIAMAIHAAGYAGRLAAWTPDGRGPDAGRRLELLDDAARDATAAVAGAGLVVVASPPLAAIGMVRALGGDLARALAPGAVVTDVASTKAAIGSAAREAGLRYVGGHPMAGRETTGVESATSDLFVDRPWVVVRDDDTRPEDVDVVVNLAVATGARPLLLSAEEHDAAVAAISHLPLVLSAALVESVAGAADWPVAQALAASGWRDMTRLAKGDPEMGAGIVATNAAAIVERLGALRDVLDDWILRIGMESPDADELRERLHRAGAALERPPEA
jgi:prephenate dehydrogenase